MDQQQKTSSEGLTWLLVGAGGLALGVFFITGPLGWWFSSRARRSALAEGGEVPHTVTAAWIVGIASTALAGLIAAFFALVLALYLGLFAAWGIGTVGLFQWFEAQHEERVEEMDRRHDERVKRMHERQDGWRDEQERRSEVRRRKERERHRSSTAP